MWSRHSVRRERALQPQNLLYASSDPTSPDYNTVKVRCSRALVPF
jgi:hypothetical protein